MYWQEMENSNDVSYMKIVHKSGGLANLTLPAGQSTKFGMEFRFDLSVDFIRGTHLIGFDLFQDGGQNQNVILIGVFHNLSQINADLDLWVAFGTGKKLHTLQHQRNLCPSW